MTNRGRYVQPDFAGEVSSIELTSTPPDVELSDRDGTFTMLVPSPAFEVYVVQTIEGQWPTVVAGFDINADAQAYIEALQNERIESVFCDLDNKNIDIELMWPTRNRGISGYGVVGSEVES